jgi:uncharacterized membrane protein YeaQ/YmgE (transglycosylase-associated protein family)
MEMQMLVWFGAVVLLGLVTGRVVGAVLAFTRGPVVYDLVSGVVGAVTGAVVLRFVGPASLHTPLLTLLTGVATAILAAWLTRIATWPPEPLLRRPDESAPLVTDEEQIHNLMTTGDGTRIFITQGRLVVPGAELPPDAQRASDDVAGALRRA